MTAIVPRSEVRRWRRNWNYRTRKWKAAYENQVEAICDAIAHELHESGKVDFRTYNENLPSCRPATRAVIEEVLKNFGELELDLIVHYARMVFVYGSLNTLVEDGLAVTQTNRNQVFSQEIDR